MFGLRKINPMVRAIGTMGAIAAVAGGVTFASLQSGAVALTDNTFTASTANLQIGSDTQTYADSVTGMTDTLVPGVPTTPFRFYLENKGTTPVSITADVPTNLTNSKVDPSAVTLSLECGNGAVAYTLDAWAAGSAVIPGGSLGVGAVWTCSATVTLNASYTNNNGQSVKPFDIDFVGNQ